MCREGVEPEDRCARYRFNRGVYDRNNNPVDTLAPSGSQSDAATSGWQIPGVATASAGHTEASQETPDTNTSLCASGEGASYVTRANLPDGRIGMVVDPGSARDPEGSEWAKSVAQAAHLRGLQPSFDQRNFPT